MELNYKIIYSKRKTITVTVERDSSLVVRAPEGADAERIHRIVESKIPWIFEKIRHPQKYKNLPHPPGKELVSGESMPYLGRHYGIEVVESRAAGIRFEQKFLVPRHLGGRGREAFRAWYIERAKEKILPRIPPRAECLGVEYVSAKITDSRFRWGSCTPKDNLNLNWRLIKAPLFVIDYIVVHELAHLIEPNHSPRFWNIVGCQVPNLEKAKGWLMEHGEFLEQDL